MQEIAEEYSRGDLSSAPLSGYADPHMKNMGNRERIARAAEEAQLAAAEKAAKKAKRPAKRAPMAMPSAPAPMM